MTQAKRSYTHRLRKREALLSMKQGNCRGSRQAARPAAAHRQRGGDNGHSPVFYAQENWYEPAGRSKTRFVVQSPGPDYFHPASVDEIRERLQLLPEEYRRQVEVVQLSRMTRKRAIFPCYGMQWGQNVYLYPIEVDLLEVYVRPPSPQQVIEAKMYGGQWQQRGTEWRLQWTRETIKDFYLNNILIHEVGHVVDERNANSEDRERYANWFAVEFGFRVSRGRVRYRSKSKSR